jgi:hypothetical protein
MKWADFIEVCEYRLLLFLVCANPEDQLCGPNKKTLGRYSNTTLK